MYGLACGFACVCLLHNSPIVCFHHILQFLGSFHNQLLLFLPPFLKRHLRHVVTVECASIIHLCQVMRLNFQVEVDWYNIVNKGHSIRAEEKKEKKKEGSKDGL